MDVFKLLAVVFVFGTAIMVAGLVFLGYLQLRDENRQPAPVRAAPKGRTGVVQAQEVASDTQKMRDPS